MKQILVLTIGICLLFASVPAMADQAEDEAAIRKVVKELYATWNAKDLAPHFALLDEDFLHRDVLKKGKVAYRNERSCFQAKSTLRVKQGEEIDFVFVTPDVAIFRNHAEDLEPALKFTSAWVFTKKSGNWLLSAFFWWPIEE